MPREVIVRIIDECEVSPVPTAAADEATYNNPKANAKKKEEKTLGDILWAYVGKRVVNMIKDEAVYYVGKYLTATEDYKSQELVQNASTSIGYATSIGFSAKVGAKMFGETAIGAVGGGAIGIAIAAMGITISRSKAYSQEGQKITENAYGNYFHAERAGLVYGGHGTEN